jgi:hypothetical protein
MRKQGLQYVPDLFTGLGAGSTRLQRHILYTQRVMYCFYPEEQSCGKDVDFNSEVAPPMDYQSELFAEHRKSGTGSERLGQMIRVVVGDVQNRRWRAEGQRFRISECWKKGLR